MRTRFRALPPKTLKGGRTDWGSRGKKGGNGLAAWERPVGDLAKMGLEFMDGTLNGKDGRPDQRGTLLFC